MTKRERIQALSHYRNDTHPVVSLYLNVTRPWEYRSRINSMVRDGIKGLRHGGSYSEDEVSRLEKLLTRMEENLLNREGSFENTKLLVIFADTQGYWEEFDLPVSYPSSLTVEPSPKVRPLLGLQEQFPLFCVVTVDSHKARMYSYGGGRITERTDIFSVEEVQPARDEASEGLGEQRYERYIKDHQLRHLKRTADVIFDTFQRENYDYLILGASDGGMINTLEENLHSYLKKYYVGSIHANPESSDAQVLEKAAETASRWETEHEKARVEALLEKANSNGRGVLGAGPTVKALMNGQVHTLYLKPEAYHEGFLCPNDHYLSLKAGECPVCGGKLRKSENIIDEMVAEAIDQRGEVSHLLSHADALGDNEVGAVLRFVM